MTRTSPASAFYVVADSTYFLGLVALINSLRLVGHDEPIYVADCGLVDAHRRLLADHVTLVEAHGLTAPHHAKTVAPLAYPTDVMVLLDADMIVTRPLTSLIDHARPGKIVAFVDRIGHRFDERWSELLGLGPLRRQPYVNTGLLVAERELGTTLLQQVTAGYEHVDVDRTLIAKGTSEYPFYYVDQDVLNAFLATFPVETLELLDHRLAPFPPFAGLSIVDEASLRCSYQDGEEPFVLHHVLKKPWIAPTRWNIYSHLLARLLLGQDVALPLRRDELPLRADREACVAREAPKRRACRSRSDAR
ncbi:MAG: hypothetical protein WEB06_13410 [Actinomycetota bacterium]